MNRWRFLYQLTPAQVTIDRHPAQSRPGHSRRKYSIVVDLTSSSNLSHGISSLLLVPAAATRPGPPGPSAPLTSRQTPTTRRPPLRPSAGTPTAVPSAHNSQPTSVSYVQSPVPGSQRQPSQAIASVDRTAPSPQRGVQVPGNQVHRQGQVNIPPQSPSGIPETNPPTPDSTTYLGSSGSSSSGNWYARYPGSN
jgi:hypothetical protein